jgi:hypothetical protein
VSDFTEIFFRPDGTDILDTGIVCSEAPWPSHGEGTWKSSDFGRSKRGTLVLTGTQNATYDADLTTGEKKTLRLRRDDPEHARDEVFIYDPNATR